MHGAMRVRTGIRQRPDRCRSLAASSRDREHDAGVPEGPRALRVGTWCPLLSRSPLLADKTPRAVLIGPVGPRAIPQFLDATRSVTHLDGYADL